MVFRAPLSLLLALLAAPAAFAHEFWIEPSDFRPAIGSVVSARILIGEGFLGEAKLRDASHILRFEMVGPSGDTPMLGPPGAEPAGVARIEAPGVHLIGYESQPRSVRLAGDKLELYIEQDGLEPFFRGDAAGPIEDHYTRYAKSLLLAGGAPAASRGYDLRLGFALELIPEKSPFESKAGASLPFLLLREGKPLAGAQVAARKRGEPATRILARTDAQGKVSLNLPGPGVWLVHSVFIRPLAGKDGEWESLWASLTFEILESPSSDSPPPAK